MSAGKPPSHVPAARARPLILPPTMSRHAMHHVFLSDDSPATTPGWLRLNEVGAPRGRVRDHPRDLGSGTPCRRPAMPITANGIRVRGGTRGSAPATSRRPLTASLPGRVVAAPCRSLHTIARRAVAAGHPRPEKSNRPQRYPAPSADRSRNHSPPQTHSASGIRESVSGAGRRILSPLEQVVSAITLPWQRRAGARISASMLVWTSLVRTMTMAPLRSRVRQCGQEHLVQGPKTSRRRSPAHHVEGRPGTPAVALASSGRITSPAILLLTGLPSVWRASWHFHPYLAGPGTLVAPLLLCRDTLEPNPGHADSRYPGEPDRLSPFTGSPARTDVIPLRFEAGQCIRPDVRGVLQP